MRRCAATTSPPVCLRAPASPESKIGWYIQWVTVVDWLLDSDPAIRWQVLRDIVRAPTEVVAAERARVVATEGWGARLLALQGEDGQWAGGACFPARSFNWRAENEGKPWTATLPTLQLLRDFGVDPRSEPVRRAVARARECCRWEHAGEPFFNGEVEPCINGRVVALCAYFDQDVDGVVSRLVCEQLDDSGWNCEAENGSDRSSFATTINVLEGLLQHERATGGFPESRAARRRAEEYLLERKLLRRKSTGEFVNTPGCGPHALAVRRAARARILPRGRGCAGLSHRRSGRGASIQAAARWQLAAGEHSSRQGPFSARGRRRSAQQVEYASGKARSQLVRAVSDVNAGSRLRSALAHFIDRHDEP
jgi:hypothetical protein